MLYEKPEMELVLWEDEELIDTLVTSPGVPGGDGDDENLSPDDIKPI